MRVVFSGITTTTIKTAKELIKQGHDIILIELSKDKIDDFTDELDCNFLHGDSGKPAILEQAAPDECDFLFCLTDSDQANILTSLLGRSMGFKKVITCIEDEDLLPLCDELGLEHTIIPARTLSQYLDNIVRGLDTVELSTLLRGSARFFSFQAKKDDEGTIEELDLPEKARVIYYYRDDDFYFADEETKIRKEDEVVILTSSEHLSDLRERWHPKEAENDD